jgi:hypothetical protein
MTFLYTTFMTKDFSNRNLRGAIFKNEDLSHARFSGSDLRGADFTGSNLSGADLTQVKTGIKPATGFWIFLFALAVSAFSGYVAMLAGETVQTMLRSFDPNVRNAGIATVIVIMLFIVHSIWKGVDHSFRYFVLPVIIIALCIGVFNQFIFRSPFCWWW